MPIFEITETNTIVRTLADRRRNATQAIAPRFASEAELVALSSNWPSRRLVEIWNDLPGVTPVARFTSRRIAARRIWRELLKQNPPRQTVSPAAKVAAPRTSGVTAPQTKGQRIVALLVRPSGATLAEIIAATGWQAHSVRGFISAQIGKRMGCRVHSFERAGMRVYRILPTPDRRSNITRKRPDSRIQK